MEKTRISVLIICVALLYKILVDNNNYSNINSSAQINLVLFYSFICVVCTGESLPENISQLQQQNGNCF